MLPSSAHADRAERGLFEARRVLFKVLAIAPRADVDRRGCDQRNPPADEIAGRQRQRVLDERPDAAAAGMPEHDDIPHAAMTQIGFNAEDANTVKPKKGTGCEKCNKTGYKGRCGLYEVMEITDELRELILVGASALELRRKAIEEGMITLRGSGLRKITEGVTTIEEVLRETVK